jgi:hypothetical protein
VRELTKLSKEICKQSRDKTEFSREAPFCSTLLSTDHAAIDSELSTGKAIILRIDLCPTSSFQIVWASRQVLGKVKALS